MAFSIADILNDDGAVSDGWKALFTGADITSYENQEAAEKDGFLFSDDGVIRYVEYKGDNIPMAYKLTVRPGFGIDLLRVGVWREYGVLDCIQETAAQFGIWVDTADADKNEQLKQWAVDVFNDFIRDVESGENPATLSNIASKLTSVFINVDAQYCYPSDLIDFVYDYMYNRYKPVDNPVQSYEIVDWPITEHGTYYGGSISLFINILLSEIKRKIPKVEIPAVWYSQFVSRISSILRTNTFIQKHINTNVCDCKASVEIDRSGNTWYLTRINLKIINLTNEDPVHVDLVSGKKRATLHGNAKIEINTSMTSSGGQYVLSTVTSGADYLSTYINKYYQGLYQLSAGSSYQEQYEAGMMSYVGELKPYTLTTLSPTLTGRGVDIDYPDWNPEEPIKTVFYINKDDPTPQPPNYNPQPSVNDRTPLYNPPKPDIPDEPTPFPKIPKDIIDPIPEPIPSNDDAFVHIYNPTTVILGNLNDALWDDNVIAELKKWWENNPMDGIVSLHKIFIKPANSSPTLQKIALGSWSSESIKAPTVLRYHSKDMGSVTIERTFNDYRDFDATVEVYLPTIGIRQLETDAVMGATLNLTYNYDVLTGDVNAIINVERDGVSNAVIYQYSGNMAVQYPVSSGTRSNLLSGIVGGVSAIASGFTGGPVGIAAGLVQTGLNVAQSHGMQIEKGGAIGGSVVPMSVLTPYVIINRPLSYDNPDRNKIMGRNTNRSARLSELDGFNSFKEIHVDIPRASEEENNLIHSFLLQGVIF